MTLVTIKVMKNVFIVGQGVEGIREGDRDMKDNKYWCFQEKTLCAKGHGDKKDYVLEVLSSRQFPLYRGWETSSALRHHDIC